MQLQNSTNPTPVSLPTVFFIKSTEGQVPSSWQTAILAQCGDNDGDHDDHDNH